MNKNKTILEIKNLDASIDDIKILNNLNLTVNAGEIHAIMGRNGSGKSTFSKVVAGHPAYNILN
jgi:Fe-S cluster assembly ATP-binding protein